ncbi:hypothetical protein INR49_029016 [Caranx melampygus]|nr:hypothetical protein INR49_029016 [Caranx melampygus]
MWEQKTQGRTQHAEGWSIVSVPFNEFGLRRNWSSVTHCESEMFTLLLCPQVPPDTSWKRLNMRIIMLKMSRVVPKKAEQKPFITSMLRECGVGPRKGNQQAVWLTQTITEARPVVEILKQPPVLSYMYLNC